MLCACAPWRVPTHPPPLTLHPPTPACIPGNIMHKGTKIQLLDLPGIIEGAAHGKGRGRQVIAVAKSSDLVLMVLDAGKVRGAGGGGGAMCVS